MPLSSFGRAAGVKDHASAAAGAVARYHGNRTAPRRRRRSIGTTSIRRRGARHRSRTTSDELILAQLMLAEGDPAGARRSLSTVIDRTAGVGDPATRAQAWLLHGRASHALGKTDEAATAVGRIVDLIEPEENRRLVLDAGSGGRSLLVRYRNRVDSSWAFLDELVRERSEPVERDATPLPAVIEPLSQRERDVLGHFPTMLTFLEIGSELYISVNTTKSPCAAFTAS